MYKLICFVGVTWIASASFTRLDRLNNFEWNRIWEFRGYGSMHPSQAGEKDFILADKERIRKIFSGVQPRWGTLPEGGARYATIIFENGDRMTIQMTTAKPLAFQINYNSRVRKSYNDFDDRKPNCWYEPAEPISEEDALYLRQILALRGPAK